MSAGAARASYLVLAAALFLAMLSESVVQTRDGSWVGDFWEHSAVVRELAAHLVDPRQPLLALDAAHAFFSPYALALAAATRVTGVSPVTVLGVAGMLNLVLLLTALPRFVRLFTARAFAPFLTLLFTLFLWGSQPLVYSGFLHFGVVGLVLPYPSTFATAATLWATVLWAEHLARPRTLRLVLVATIGVVVVLTHPVAGLFLVTLLAAFAVQRPRRLGSLAVVGAALVAAAVVWPYYPFFQLLREGSVFDASNRALYESMLHQVLPALVAVVFLPARLRANRLDPLALTLVVLFAVYVVGDWTDRWSLGRVLPYCVLLLHVVLADRVAGATVRGRAAAAAAIAMAVLFIAWPLLPLDRPLARLLPHGIASAWADPLRHESVGSAYSRLFRGTPRDAVTMATADTGWEVPTYGGRIVAPDHPQAFVSGLEGRDGDAAVFFDRATPDALRRRLICRYDVSYVLVDTRDGRVTASALARLTTVVRRVDPYALLGVREACPRG